MSEDTSYVCEVCGEQITMLQIEMGQAAEMFKEGDDDSMIVHAECGVARGMEMA